MKSKGRPRKFTAAHEQQASALIAEKPAARLRSIVSQLDLPVDTSTLAKHLRRIGLRRKTFSDEPVGWPDERARTEIKAYLDAIADVPEENRVYVDESFSHTHAMARRGRAPRGQQPRRSRESHGKRYMFCLAIRKSGLLHAPAIGKMNMSDAVWVNYVRVHLVPNLRAGDVVIWDRLGKAGRAVTSKRQHYNPEAIAMVEAVGARVIFLPPKGKM
jgi:hypothetical protein